MKLVNNRIKHSVVPEYESPSPVLAGLPLLKRCLHKDIYDLGDRLLMVANDAILNPCTLSTEMVKEKGVLATRQSAFWFQQLSEICPNHHVQTNIRAMLEAHNIDSEYFVERATLVTKMIPLPVLCKVQGYLTDSAWQEYQETGSIAEAQLPEGMEESQRLPAPVFIPIFKEPVSDDDFNELKEFCSQDLSSQIRNTALDLYFKAWKIARRQNVLLVSCFFRFGLHEDKIHLIGECITPDSSLFTTPGLSKYRPTLSKAGENMFFYSQGNSNNGGRDHCQNKTRIASDSLHLLFSKLTHSKS